MRRRRGNEGDVVVGASHYRRGAVMGLTIAEIFMLLAFMLLLLLALWRYVDLSNARSTEEFQKLSTEDQRLVLDAAGRGYMPALAILGGAGLAPEDVTHAAEALAKGSRLVDKDEFEKTFGAMSALSDRQRVAFEELVRSGRVETLLEVEQKLGALPEAERQAAREALSGEWLEALGALRAAGFTAEDIGKLSGPVAVSEDTDAALQQAREMLALSEEERAALAGLRAAVDPEKIDKDLALVAKLREQGIETATIADAGDVAQAMPPDDLAKLARSRKLQNDVARVIEGEDAVARGVARQLEEELGALVRTMGGEIDPMDGKVTLPEQIVFQAGSAEITREMQGRLREFCPAWLATMYRNREGLLEARIEGHASSDWTEGSTVDQAYLGNMGLSQRRSAAVLRFCLSALGAEIDREWVRRSIVAVGLSSGRPILDDEGDEVRSKSRRVVFGFVTR